MNLFALAGRFRSDAAPDKNANEDAGRQVAEIKNGSREILDPFRLFARYFLLRRWWRVLRNSLRCFFLDIRLRRFLTTEPIRPSFCFLVRARRPYNLRYFSRPTIQQLGRRLTIGHPGVLLPATEALPHHLINSGGGNPK